MILSGKEIQKRMGKDIFIEPFDPSRINPNSYNLSLHNELMVYDNDILDMKVLNTAHKIIIQLGANRLMLRMPKKDPQTTREPPILWFSPF